MRRAASAGPNAGARASTRANEATAAWVRASAPPARAAPPHLGRRAVADTRRTSSSSGSVPCGQRRSVRPERRGRDERDALRAVSEAAGRRGRERRRPRSVAGPADGGEPATGHPLLNPFEERLAQQVAEEALEHEELAEARDRIVGGREGPGLLREPFGDRVPRAPSSVAAVGSGSAGCSPRMPAAACAARREAIDLVGLEGRHTVEEGAMTDGEAEVEVDQAPLVVVVVPIGRTGRGAARRAGATRDGDRSIERRRPASRTVVAGAADPGPTASRGRC